MSGKQARHAKHWKNMLPSDRAKIPWRVQYSGHGELFVDGGLYREYVAQYGRAATRIMLWGYRCSRKPSGF